MQNSDFEWFVQNILKLYKLYGNKYIAIKNKTVLGVYDSYSEGIEQTRTTEELGTFIVQELGSDESVYTAYLF